MDNPPNNWVALLSLVFVLGLKHGLDADHLATIDGLTRYNLGLRVRLARWCGLLFSAGHGTVVIIASVMVGTLSHQWEVPTWAEDFGALSSIVFLSVLGAANLRAVVSTPAHLHVQPVGMKSRLLARFQSSSNPFLIALVGAVFALSFDTMSLVALFALAASDFGGWAHALALGVVFTLGMLLADSANGLWISRLLNRADRAALLASRMMGLAVAGISLLVAAFGAAKYFLPAVERWSEGKDLLFGACVTALLGLTFVTAVRLTRTGEAPVPAERS